jgi:pimeloyl-ACP methyl ester carboxylesterase
VSPERARSAGFEAATRDDPAFNRDFRHCFSTVNGVQMHYVIGGTGPQTVVLLHGWPESWFEFRDVMPQLLAGRTVIALELPGMHWLLEERPERVILETNALYPAG